jgi:hypothetical protein
MGKKVDLVSFRALQISQMWSNEIEELMRNYLGDKYDPKEVLVYKRYSIKETWDIMKEIAEEEMKCLE